MSEVWIVFVVLFTLIESITPQYLFMADQMKGPPLSKSLGYTIQRRSNTKANKPNHDHVYQFNDMFKESLESLGEFTKRHERRLRSAVGDTSYEMLTQAGVLDRRRNTLRLQSAVGKRRARKQASRRQKLNTQSMRSHREHSRQTTPNSSSE